VSCRTLVSLQIDFAQLFISLVVLLFSLTVHEAAHAWSADRLGDPTGRLLGRVSLNPAVHVDPIGTIVFPLLAMVSHLPIIGWAKPVPVDPRNLRHPRRDFMFIAAAGPASNLVLAALGAIVLRSMIGGAAPGTELPGAAAAIVWDLVRLNVLLAVFNMIPVPPLDGGNVLAGLLPASVAVQYDRLRPWGFVLLYGLMFTGALSALVVPPASFILSVLL